MFTTARRPIAHLLAAFLFATLLFTFAPTAHAQSTLTVTAVHPASHYNAAGHEITFSNGVTLFSPTRPFIDAGRAPQVGQPVVNFVDQSSFLGWYYGYASFTVANTPYVGYRR